MASTVSWGNISSQQLEWEAAGHHSHRQNSIEDLDEHLSSFSADHNPHSMGPRFNLAVDDTWENISTSSDVRRKIKWEFKHKNDPVDQNPTLVTAEFEEPAEKAETWNKNKSKASDAVQPESTHLRTGIGIVPLIKEHGEIFKKRTFSTFSVSLSREKIEADLLAMGGSKRSRRIKKRPKNVQRQLDDLFPGLRLKYITPDNYRVRMS